MPTAVPAALVQPVPRVSAGTDGGRVRQHHGLPQDGLLEIDQPPPRVDPELVGEQIARAAERGQRLALPSARILAGGQQPPALLPERRVAHESLGFDHRVGVVTAPHPRVDQPFPGHQPPLVQPGRLRRGPPFGGELREGRSAP
jgi:hypothetical protein